MNWFSWQHLKTNNNILRKISTTESEHPQINVAFSSSGQGLHRHFMRFITFIYLLKAVLCMKQLWRDDTFHVPEDSEAGVTATVTRQVLHTPACLAHANSSLTVWWVSEGTEAKISSQNHSFAVPHQITCCVYSDNIQGEDPGHTF